MNVKLHDELSDVILYGFNDTDQEIYYFGKHEFVRIGTGLGRGTYYKCYICGCSACITENMQSYKAAYYYDSSEEDCKSFKLGYESKEGTKYFSYKSCSETKEIMDIKDILE